MFEVKEELTRFEWLKTERSNFENMAQDVADFCLPHREINRKSSPGSQRNLTLYDDTGQRAAFLLASAEHQSLVGQSTDWFYLDSYLKENRRYEIKSQLEEIEEVLKYEYQRSNFYPSMMEYMIDKVVFGTTYIIIDDVFDPRRNMKILNFRCLPWEQCYIDENELDQVDTLYRCYEMPVHKLAALYKRYAPDFILKEARTEPNKMYKVLHVVRPKEKGEQTINDSHKYISVVILIDSISNNKSVILNAEPNGNKVKGFPEFPLAITRFKRMPGEKYGRSPAMDALPSMRMLNKTKELAIQGAEIAILPPFVYQSSNISGQNIEWVPGKGFAVRDVQQIREWQTGARVDVAQLIVRDLQIDVEKNFFIDQIQFPPLNQQGTPATATEISARVSFMNRIIEPIFGRLVSEGLDNIISRSLKLLSRRPIERGGIHPLPDGLIKAEYNGPLARNQRFEESISIDEMLEFSARARPTVPEIDDVFNTAAAIRERSSIRGVPKKVLYSPREEEERRQSRQEAEQAMRQLQMTQMGADAASKMAPAMQGGNGRI